MQYRVSVQNGLAHFSWSLQIIFTKNLNHQHCIDFLTTLSQLLSRRVYLYHSKKHIAASRVQELSGLMQWCRNGHPWWMGCFQKIPDGLSSWHPFASSIELAPLPIFEGLTNHKSRRCREIRWKHGHHRSEYVHAKLCNAVMNLRFGAKTKSNDRQTTRLSTRLSKS